MYRIELSPGEETAFRSIEELAVAIRRNVVTSRARIYHQATGKWLPIQFHPHYKQALSMPLTQADLVAGPPVAPLSTLNLGEPQAPATPPALSSATRTQAAMAAWPEPKPPAAPPALPVSREPIKHAAPTPAPIQLGTPAPVPRVVAQPRAPAPRMAELRRPAEPARGREPKKAKGSRRRRKPLRPLRVALAGAVIIACAHLAVTTTAKPSEALARPRTPRHLIEAPAHAVKEMTPRTVAAVMPVLQSIPVPGLTGRPAATERTAPAPQPKFTAPVPGGSAVANDSGAADIEAAPDIAELRGTVPAGDSLAPSMVDSTGKKTLKRILRSIGGPATTEGKSPKR